MVDYKFDFLISLGNEKCYEGVMIRPIQNYILTVIHSNYLWNSPDQQWILPTLIKTGF